MTNNSSEPLNILLLGKSGAGKGTQAELLKDHLNPTLFIETGSLFRNLAEKNTLAGKRVRRVLEEGGLQADWIASFLWQKKLVEELNSEDQHIIFDGVARRLPEAKLLDKVMRWFDREVTPILLDVTREEAARRLKRRGREDDTEEQIKNRLDWYETEVTEVIDYYQNQNRLVQVDGMPKKDQVFQNIIKALNLE